MYSFHSHCAILKRKSWSWTLANVGGYGDPKHPFRLKDRSMILLISGSVLKGKKLKNFLTRSDFFKTILIKTHLFHHFDMRMSFLDSGAGIPIFVHLKMVKVAKCKYILRGEIICIHSNTASGILGSANCKLPASLLQTNQIFVTKFTQKKCQT